MKTITLARYLATCHIKDLTRGKKKIFKIISKKKLKIKKKNLKIKKKIKKIKKSRG